MGKIRTAITQGITRFFGNAGDSFSTWAANTFGKWNRARLMNQYKGLVYTLVNAIAEDFAKYDPIFWKQDNRSGKRTQYIHPFEKVLENPNPSLSKFDLLVATASFLELTGDAFWYYAVGERSRQPKEIYLMRPDRVEVVVDGDTGEVIGYKFRNDDGTKIPLEVDEVEHIKTFNPLNQYRGMGTLEAAILYVEIENDTSEFQRNFMKNQATPSGVLTISGKIEKEAFNKLKTQWKEKQAGLANVGKTLFIREADAKFTKVGLGLDELDLKALKELSEGKLFKMFRVPKIILGDTDQNGLGRANAEVADYIFAKRTIDPKQIRLDDAIQKTLKRNYADQNTVVGHVSQIPEDKAAQLNEDDKLTGRVYTINEVRERKGLPKVDGGDKLYVSFNQVPIDEEINTGTDNGSKSVAKKRVIRLAAKKDAAEETFFRRLNKIDGRAFRSSKKAYNGVLEAQRAAVVEKLSAYADKGVTRAYEELMPVESEETNKAAEYLLPILLLALGQGGEAALAFLGVDQEMQISPATQRLLEDRLRRALRDNTNATIAKLQKTISEGIAANETIEQLTARVNKVYEKAMGYRSDTLADDQSHKAVNKGLQEAYRLAGITRKQWRALGANPCKFCLSMNGEIIEMDSNYVPKGGSIVAEDGEEYVSDYEDIENANAHPNCHCWLFPVRD